MGLERETGIQLLLYNYIEKVSGWRDFKSYYAEGVNRREVQHFFTNV